MQIQLLFLTFTGLLRGIFVEFVENWPLKPPAGRNMFI